MFSIGEIIFNPSMTFATNTTKIKLFLEGYYDLPCQMPLINQEKSLREFVFFFQWLLLSYRQVQFYCMITSKSILTVR